MVKFNFGVKKTDDDQSVAQTNDGSQNQSKSNQSGQSTNPFADKAQNPFAQKAKPEVKKEEGRVASLPKTEMPETAHQIEKENDEAKETNPERTKAVSPDNPFAKSPPQQKEESAEPTAKNPFAAPDEIPVKTLEQEKQLPPLPIANPFAEEQKQTPPVAKPKPASETKTDEPASSSANNEIVNPFASFKTPNKQESGNSTLELAPEPAEPAKKNEIINPFAQNVTKNPQKANKEKEVEEKKIEAGVKKFFGNDTTEKDKKMPPKAKNKTDNEPKTEQIIRKTDKPNKANLPDKPEPKNLLQQLRELKKDLSEISSNRKKLESKKETLEDRLTSLNEEIRRTEIEIKTVKSEIKQQEEKQKVDEEILAEIKAIASLG